MALDARTGKLVWNTTIADRTKGFSNTSGPIVVKGKVMQGLQGCDRYREERCIISAYDANTGKQLWKFHTIAHTGEPGGDTWGTLPDMMRAGGETWIVGSYDPDLDLTYWGIAQPKPWMPASRGTSIKDAALYGASTVALRGKDGTLAWHYQHIPAETLDHDEVFERVLVDIGQDKVVFTHRQGRHPVEARSQDRPLPGPPRDGVPERLHAHRSRDRRARVPRRHQGPEAGRVDQLRARAPRAATTGRR